MKKTLIILVIGAALVALACGPDTPAVPSNTPILKVVDLGSDLYRLHDDEFAVTCWKYRGFKKGGLSCIPDWQLEVPHE